MELTEAEDINKRWQEYTEELHKKDLHDKNNMDITEAEDIKKSWQEYTEEPCKKKRSLRLR